MLCRIKHLRAAPPHLTGYDVGKKFFRCQAANPDISKVRASEAGRGSRRGSRVLSHTGKRLLFLSWSYLFNFALGLEQSVEGWTSSGCGAPTHVPSAQLRLNSTHNSPEAHADPERVVDSSPSLRCSTCQATISIRAVGVYCKVLASSVTVTCWQRKRQMFMELAGMDGA